MMKSSYQHGDLSLVLTDSLPPSARKSDSAPRVALDRDVNGHEYIIACDLECEPGIQAPALYCLGKARYVEVKSPALLTYKGTRSVRIAPGIYRIGRASEYNYKEHGEAVALHVVLVGKALGFDEQHLSELEFASLIHDIGLTGLEDTLWKPKWFTDEDWKLALQHPARSARVVEKLKGRVPEATDRVRDYVLHHHEHVDGSGYPDGLSGEDIPIGSRIILIADAFHAMLSWRPFREPLPEHVALDRLWGDADYRYDRKILNIFTDVLDELAISALAG